VKIVLKMHQKPFGPTGELKCSPRPPSCNIGPTSKRGDGRGRKGKGWEGEGQPHFLATPLRGGKKGEGREGGNWGGLGGIIGPWAQLMNLLSERLCNVY